MPSTTTNYNSLNLQPNYQNYTDSSPSTGLYNGNSVLATNASPVAIDVISNLNTNPTDIADRVTISTEKPLRSFDDYINDDLSKFLMMFSPESKQTASEKNLQHLQQVLYKQALNYIKNGKSKIEELANKEKPSLLKDYLNNIVEQLNSDNTQEEIISYMVDNNPVFENFFSEMITKGVDYEQAVNQLNTNCRQTTTDIKFKSLLLNLTCKDDSKLVFCTISAIAQSLYEKSADENRKQEIVSFMRLSLNVTYNAHANDICKAKLLLETLSLIENNINCKSQIEQLSDKFSNVNASAVTGFPEPQDDKYLIDVFNNANLTTAQHNIKPTTKAIISEDQPITQTTQLTINNRPKIATQAIDNKYIEPIKNINLTSKEFENLVNNGTFSNRVFYTVHGNVKLSHIEKLPQHVKTFGTVSIKNSPRLKELPSDFIIVGDASLYNCPKLMKITPDGNGLFHIQGTLTINKCNSITSLSPTNTFDIHLINCKNLREVLSGKYRNLTIEGCDNFYKIHPDTVVANLTLIKNKKFTSFADNLTVADLSVIFCPIEDLVSKLAISGDLLFKSCNNLQSINSSNVELAGNITIDNCHELIRIISESEPWPRWICSPKADGSLREMKILGNYSVLYIPERVNLITPSAEDLAKLIDTKKRAIFNTYSLIEHFAKFANCSGQINFPYVSPYLSIQELNNLGEFLLKLRNSSDYNHKNRQLLANQVFDILSLLQVGVDENLFRTTLETIDESISSCVDRGALHFDNLLMLNNSQKAKESKDITQIKLVAKHSIIIGMSDAISMQHPRDQVENILKARLKIREIFNLPNGIQSMNFEDFSNFNFRKQDIKYIAENSTDEAVDKFIASGDLNWDEFNKSKIFLPKFESLPPKYVNKMPVCYITYESYSEMVEYKDDYYGYETLLKIYRNKQKITDKHELVDPTHIYKIVLTKDANT
jgi:hypothetical protein